MNKVYRNGRFLSEYIRRFKFYLKALTTKFINIPQLFTSDIGLKFCYIKRIFENIPNTE